MNSEIHTILVSVLGAVSIAAILGSATAIIRRSIDADRTIRRIGHFVLPHFEPPTPAEIRSGKPDLTIPARIESLESANVAIQSTVERSVVAHEKVADDLRLHLVEEEQQAKAALLREEDRDRKIDVLMEVAHPLWDGIDRRAPVRGVRKPSVSKKPVAKKSARSTGGSPRPLRDK